MLGANTHDGYVEVREAHQSKHLEHELRAQLVAGLGALSLQLSSSQVDDLLAFLDLLSDWNRAYNLTAVRDPAAMITRHLLDSLSILPWLHGEAVLDVGAGAGLPGIPLAIAAAQRRFTLLDSNGKKVRFMRHVQRSLGLGQVAVQQSRIESYRPADRPDCVVARAFAMPAKLLHQVAHVCAAGTRVLAMTGRRPQQLSETMSGLPYRFLEGPALTVPGSADHRHLLVFERL